MINKEEYKKKLLMTLPVKVGDFIVRELKRDDLDVYANWPDYPLPYKMFNTSLKKKSLSERDKRWEEYLLSNDSISLVIDHKDEKVIGKFSLSEIHWNEMYINNMGIRVHPKWCDRGNGTLMLKVISNWCFNNGIVKIKFDVLSTNHRAVKSYKNVGYKIVEEFNRGNDIFYWMELRRD